MKKYTAKSNILSTLNPAEYGIYQLILRNNNKRKQKQQLLTRKFLKKLINYALGTVANALQILRSKGLIFYNKSSKSWCLVFHNSESIDIYDFHVKFKWDWPNFIALGDDGMTRMNWYKHKRKSLETDKIESTDDYSEPYQELNFNQLHTYSVTKLMAARKRIKGAFDKYKRESLSKANWWYRTALKPVEDAIAEKNIDIDKNFDRREQTLRTSVYFQSKKDELQNDQKNNTNIDNTGSTS